MSKTNTAHAGLRLEIERLTYQNAENGWTVVRARDCANQQLLTAVGFLGAIAPGETLRVEGSWQEHRSFGRQFRIDSATPSEPVSAAAIERYLASGLFKGVGKATAKKIVARFGDDTLQVLDHTPQRLNQIPRLGKTVIRAVQIAWKKHREERDLLLFLGEHGLSSRFRAPIVAQFGDKPIAAVRKDPYALIRKVPGVGFVTADRMAQSLGLPADAPERYSQGMIHVLRLAQDRGHCYLNTEQLLTQMSEQLRLEEPLAVEVAAPLLKKLASQRQVKTIPAGDGEHYHFSQDLYDAEQAVADKLAALLARPARERKVPAAEGLSPDQEKAVRRAVAEPLFILSGGPGVGKTTTVNAIVKAFRAGGADVLLCAPTGRAAQRLSQVSGMEARTIHRALEWSPGARGFLRGEHNPLEADVVIVDEASMLDIRLFASLLAAILPSTQLILVGDADQLPSVGPGHVLRDLLAIEAVPATILTQVFRQAASSHIISHAHEINRGVMPKFAHDKGLDCYFLTARSKEATQETIRKLVAERLPAMGFDPRSETQVLSPMNRGDLGCQGLNPLLRQWLGIPAPREGQAYAAGDRVIQLANNYDLNVFNGDIGVIEQLTSEGAVVRFAGEAVVYEPLQMSALGLAYAITIHKSQGSEFPVVIIPLTNQHYVMLQRNLIYTALTRARRLAVFVGDPRALAIAVGQDGSAWRQTHLRPALTEEIARHGPDAS